MTRSESIDRVQRPWDSPRMAGFTKLFGSIVHSTIWREPTTTRIVWITMLALKDGKGDVHASVPGLADAARVTREECEDALKRLGSPDPDSSNKLHEGRRVIPIEGGWFVVSHQKYSRMLSIEERRERDAARKRLQRASANVRDVTDVAESLPSRSRSNPDPDPNSDVVGAPPAAKPRAPRVAKWTIVPQDWNPNDKHRAKAKAKGWTDAEFEGEVEKFRNHDFGAPKSRPDATFSNWMDSDIAARGKGQGGAIRGLGGVPKFGSVQPSCGVDPMAFLNKGRKS